MQQWKLKQVNKLFYCDQITSLVIEHFLNEVNARKQARRLKRLDSNRLVCFLDLVITFLKDYIELILF